MLADETYEGVVLSWKYIFLGNEIPPIRYRTYTIQLPDKRIYRIKERILLELDVGDTVLVVFPMGNVSQVYLSSKRTTGTSTVPNSDYLDIYKML